MTLPNSFQQAFDSWIRRRNWNKDGARRRARERRKLQKQGLSSKEVRAALKDWAQEDRCKRATPLGELKEFLQAKPKWRKLLLDLGEGAVVNTTFLNFLADELVNEFTREGLVFEGANMQDSLKLGAKIAIDDLYYEEQRDRRLIR